MSDCDKLIKRKIPIVCSTDNRFVEVALVCLDSLVRAANEGTFYNIYILIDEEFSDSSKEKIHDYFKEFNDQCAVEFKPIAGKMFSNVYLGIAHTRKQTYFRLLISSLLDWSKCIYIDLDTIIVKDLGELYDVDIENYYIAGVKAAGYFCLPNISEYCKQARLPDISQYVNAGVLLINLRNMRNDNLVERFLKLLPLNMIGQDQDIINSVCYGHIKFLPFKFNVMSKYANWFLSDYKDLFDTEELLYGWNNPVIIHYADEVKPWNKINCPLGDYWWKSCANSKTKNYFFKLREEEFFNTAIYYSGNTLGDGITKKSAGNLFRICQKRKIVVYGAGKKATQLLRYMKENDKLPEYFVVSEREDNLNSLYGIPVRELSELEKVNVDITLVIAVDERYQLEILRNVSAYKFMEIVPLNNAWQY